MSYFAPSCQRHRHGVRTHIVAGLLNLLVGVPALAHYGDFTMRPQTTLAATFSVGPLSNGSAESKPDSAFAWNIEVNYPPGYILFGMYGLGSGLVISMNNVSFDNPSVGTFVLTNWALDLVTSTGFPQGGPLASDGSFAVADHELRIDQGQLSGTLVGFGSIERDFATDPLTLGQLSALTGHAFGDTSGDDASISLAIPFDHFGSLAGTGDMAVDVRIQGLFRADAHVEVIPEPSAAALFAGGLVALAAWRRRQRSAREPLHGPSLTQRMGQ